MKYNQVLWFVALLFLPLSNALGLIDSFSRLKLSDDVEIVAIGDLHDIDNNTDRLHKELFFGKEGSIGYLDQWANGNEDTLMILESSDEACKENEKAHNIAKRFIPNHYIGLYYELSSYAKKLNFRNKSLHFRFADPRGNGILAMTLAFVSIQTMFPAYVQLLELNPDQIRDIIDFDSYLSQNLKSKREFFDNKKNIDLLRRQALTYGSVTAKECLNQLKNNIDEFRSFRDKYDSTSVEYTIMNDFLSKIQNGYVQLQQLFNIHLKNLEEPCVNSIFNRLQQTESFDSVIKILTDWLQDTSNAITDAGIMKAVFLGKKSFKRIIIFAGNNHTTAINNILLKKCNAQAIVQKGLLENVKLYVYEGPRFKVSEVEEYLHSCFKQKNETNKIDSSVVSRCCLSCHKTEKEVQKLFHCGACRQAFYCSQECQRKDWSQHKQVCKKQN